MVWWGSLQWGADTPHIPLRAFPGASPQHSHTTLSPTCLWALSSRDPGAQIRVTPWRLRWKISMAGCLDRGDLNSSVRLQREALRRKGPAILYDGDVERWCAPHDTGLSSRIPSSRHLHFQAMKLGSAFNLNSVLCWGQSFLVSLLYFYLSPPIGWLSISLKTHPFALSVHPEPFLPFLFIWKVPESQSLWRSLEVETDMDIQIQDYLWSSSPLFLLLLTSLGLTRS